MTYKFITEIDHEDQNEVGAPAPHREGFLLDAAADLRAAMQALADLRAKQPPAPVVGGAVKPTVKQMIRFHEDTAKHQSHQEQVAAAELEVIRQRNWITRMGGVVDGNGRLNMAASVRTVQYDNQLNQTYTKVKFISGKLIFADSRELVDTTRMVTAFSGPGKGIFAMSATDKGPGGGLHISSHSIGERHHSSLLAATQAWIAAAGEIEVSNGTITWLSNKSGHYAPNVDHFLQVLHHLQKNFVPLIFPVTFCTSAGETDYVSVDAFMKANDLDDDSYDYKNLMYAYGAHVRSPALLQTNGWEYRPQGTGTLMKPVKPGIYNTATNTLVPHREARKWLRSQKRFGVDIPHKGDALSRQ